MTPEQEAALDLFADLSPLERVGAIAQHAEKRARAAEGRKDHPLKHHRMGQADQAAHRAHMTDGGGSLDARAVGLELLQAILADDQVQFDLLVHYAKSCLKQHGLVTAIPGGGVSLTGVAPPRGSQP